MEVDSEFDETSANNLKLLLASMKHSFPMMKRWAIQHYGKVLMKVPHTTKALQEWVLEQPFDDSRKEE